MTVSAVGIDVADVNRISRLYAARGDVFASRWFTKDELDQCLRRDDPGTSLAVRFAAKEAVWKALGAPVRDPLPWRCISVIEAGSVFTVQLGGSVRSLAQSLGVDSIQCSVDVCGQLAVAFAVAIARG